uniref:Smr domain-containing protein n=1 Tax=Odontella aurita TaxID=265563 RepID=A0A7S4IIR1_9STRA|mmetsp:Transcript_25757/g.75978  ORF Transcript_25757/g.75978 Transcript_25757/m.75978 type:complete len:936 (+) Transcript_25757:238-3045(+)
MNDEGVDADGRTYASLMHACARGGQVRVALSLLEEMRRSPHLTPDAKVWGAALHACARAGEDTEAVRLMREMQTPNQGGDNVVRPNTLHYNALLAALAKKAGNAQLAMEVLEGMVNGTAMFAPPDQEEEEERRGDDDEKDQWQARRPQQHHHQHHHQHRRRAHPDLVTLNTVLAACAKSFDYASAQSLLDRLRNGDYLGHDDAPLRPDAISYNTVLSSCSDPSDAVALLREMRLSRRDRYSAVKPTAVSYTNAISCCKNSNPPDLDRALRLLEEARVGADGVKPNVFMYSAAIWTAERAGNCSVAERLLRDMTTAKGPRGEEEGWGCSPNVVSYDGVISCHAKRGNMDEAMALYDEMRTRGIVPTPVTYQKLAEATGRSNSTAEENISVLETIVSTMSPSERRSKTGGPVLASLVRSYGILRNYDDARRIYDAVQGPVDAPCLTSMLYACWRARPVAMWEDAALLLHSSDIVPDAVGPGRIDARALSYAVLACCREGQWEEATKLLDLYGKPALARSLYDDNGKGSGGGGGSGKSGGPVVSAGALNALISSCGRAGRPDVAVRTLNEMESRFEVKPDGGSYRGAIVACNQAEHERRRQRRRTRRREMARMEGGDYADDMWEEGWGGDQVGVAVEEEEEDEGLQWWECSLSLLRRMKEEGIVPDVQTYSSAISSCEAAGQWQRAIGILRSMSDESSSLSAPSSSGGDDDRREEEREGEGLIALPNLFCFNAAIAACEKGGAWLEAVELFERIRTDGSLRPNFVTVNSLLIALDRAGQRELADAVYREAVKDGVVKPWKMRRDVEEGGRMRRVMDLHQFSAPMAKIAVRAAIESLVNDAKENRDNDHNFFDDDADSDSDSDSDPSATGDRDLVFIVGKGRGSEDGRPVLAPVVGEVLRREFGLASSTDVSNSGRLRVKREEISSYLDRITSDLNLIW